MSDYYSKYINLIDINKEKEKPIIKEKIMDIPVTEANNFQFNMIVENGLVVIPEQGILRTNVYIKDGKIAVLGFIPNATALRTVDAYGYYVLPGIVDPHVHFGIYTPIEDEIHSESKSALIGGVTTVGSFFSAERSHFTSFPYIEKLIQEKSYVDVIPHLVIQTREQVNELHDYEKLLGVNSFKLYMSGIPGMIPDVSDDFILDVLERISKNSIVAVHAENNKLIQRATNRIKNEKGDKANLMDWYDSHPDYAEEDAVLRMINFSNLMEKKVYLVHISTKRAIEAIANSKKDSQYLTIETTSPYLAVALVENDMNYKMTPPLRKNEDIEALWQAFENGVIDTIGTDHVAIKRNQESKSMWDTLSGYSIVEHHLPVMWNEGVTKRKKDILKLVNSMTKKPAETFGVYPQKGTLLPGSDADIVILDPHLEKTIAHEDLVSVGNFSIYHDKTIKGWPVMTIKSGNVVVENGELTGYQSDGNVIKRY